MSGMVAFSGLASEGRTVLRRGPLAVGLARNPAQNGAANLVLAVGEGRRRLWRGPHLRIEIWGTQSW